MVPQAIENGLWSIKCSRDRWHHVTSKGQTVSRLSTGWGPPILYIVCCHSAVTVRQYGRLS